MGVKYSRSTASKLFLKYNYFIKIRSSDSVSRICEKEHKASEVTFAESLHSMNAARIYKIFAFSSLLK